MTHARKFAIGMACVLAYVGFGLLPAGARPVLAQTAHNLGDLSLEELSDIVVTSVSRRDQSILKAAASVYIITGDEIRRLGATTLPEALRLAPNLQVAAIDARQYAISARGFNDNVANKLLVMVDGRTIYSPLFSGVFWDAQDFVPSDIDRIEVISGAAGATWGTNAVNGVINVVTRSAAATQGTAVTLTAGSQERTAVARQGIELSNGLAVRAHARTFERDTSRQANGREVGDASKGTSLGMRADWAAGDDALLITAGLSEGSTEARRIFGPVHMRETNVTGRWTRRLSEVTDFDVQGYFDSTTRSDNFLLQDAADIYDVETKFRHVQGVHRWLGGLGLRHARDRADPGLFFSFFPTNRRQNWTSVFVQDEIDLTGRLALTLGLRMERNPYSGWESLPNARLGYSPDSNTLFWAALSRAVRSPSRFDRELFLPPRPPFVISGGPNFTSEVARVAEVGYRQQLGPRASLSVTGFLHDYDRLRSGEHLNGLTVFGNEIAGQVRGFEAWGNWQPTPKWRLDGGLLWLDKNLRLKAGSTDDTGPSRLGNDPDVQWSLRSSHTLGQGWDLAVAVRHVGQLPSPVIAAYTATDLTLNWVVRKDIRLTAGVRDLFDRRHLEYQGFASLSGVPRAGFMAISYGLP